MLIQVDGTAWSPYYPPIKLIPHIKMKEKKHVILALDTEKAFDKVQHAFMTKTLNKIGIEGTYLNTMKSLYEKHTASIIINEGKLKAFPLRPSARQRCPL